MKKVFILIILFLYQIGFTQEISDIGKITLGISMPENSDFSERQESLFAAKLKQIITSEGMASYNYSNFSITPKAVIQNSEVVEGGMRNIHVVWLDIDLSIHENATGLLFSSHTFTTKGSGINNEKAISDAINKINAKSNDFKKFLTEGKNKIISYYKEKCTSIIKNSDMLTQRHQYEEAIASLMSIPDAVTECYTTAQKKSLQIYVKYQEKNCKENIQKAKAMIATKDYDDALQILMNIDSSTSCFNEAKTQIAVIENKIKVEDNKQWNFMLQQYKDAVSLEKHRINAVKEIASSYYKSKNSNVYIVR